MLVESPQVRARFELHHLDTADRRDLQNIGRLDVTNVVLALRDVGAMALRTLRERPDLIYLPVAQSALAWVRDGLFILIGRAGGARVVTHLHVGGFDGFLRATNPLARAWIGWTQGRAHRALVLGEGLRPAYAGVLPPGRVRVAPNGVPEVVPLSEGDGGASDTTASAAPATPPTVLFLGQLSAPKGVLDLLDAAARLCARGLDFRLVLAGSWASAGEREEAVRRIERNGGLSSRVSLPGVLTGRDKVSAFASAQVFVLPTWYAPEAQPLSVLEAMSAALPVVATARGAIPDMVHHGENGLLVPEQDSGALADALARLLEEPAVARRMGQAGRRLYLERFTVERCMDRIAALLEDALFGGEEEADAPRLAPSASGHSASAPAPPESEARRA